MPEASGSLHVRTSPDTEQHVAPRSNERRPARIRAVRGNVDIPLDGLLDGVRGGDETALKAIMKEFSPLVYGTALSVTGSASDAEDVLQEVFIGLPEALGRFDGRNFPGWLYVVAKRRALMTVRSRDRRDGYDKRAARQSARHSEDHTLDRIAIERALASLPEAYRSVFLLKEAQGLSHREIAETLGISVALSQTRLFRARAALRKLLVR